MNIRSALELEHSKTLTEKVVKYIAGSTSRFHELMEAFLGDERLISQRAAWAFGYIGASHPELLEKYYPQLLKKLSEPKLHNAIHRNILRAFESTEIPEKYQAELLDICIAFITSEHHPVAVRAFAITTACNISRNYPELKTELKLILEELNRHPQTPAIKSRIKQAFKILAR